MKMETAKEDCISYDLGPSETYITFLKYVHKLTSVLLQSGSHPNPNRGAHPITPPAD